MASLTGHRRWRIFEPPRFRDDDPKYILGLQVEECFFGDNAWQLRWRDAELKDLTSSEATDAMTRLKAEVDGLPPT